MQVAFALFAEYAQMTPDGRLNALGLDLHLVQTDSFPLELPSLFLIVKLVFEPEEREAKYRFTVQMLAPDGKRLEPSLETEFSPPPPQEPGWKVASTLVGNFGGMKFDSPGDYTFPILVNGKELTAIRVNVQQVGPTTPLAQRPSEVTS